MKYCNAQKENHLKYARRYPSVRGILSAEGRQPRRRYKGYSTPSATEIVCHIFLFQDTIRDVTVRMRNR